LASSIAPIVKTYKQSRVAKGAKSAKGAGAETVQKHSRHRAKAQAMNPAFVNAVPLVAIWLPRDLASLDAFAMA
jgi:hypothetical protein